MTGEEIARELINVLSVEYGISSDRVLASMRDRASANGVTYNANYSDHLLKDVRCWLLFPYDRPGGRKIPHSSSRFFCRYHCSLIALELDCYGGTKQAKRSFLTAQHASGADGK